MYWRLWLNRIVVTAMAVLTDALAINSALYMTYIWVRPLNIEGQAQFDNTPISAIWMFLAILNGVMFVTFVTTGLYALPRGVSRIDESFKILFSVTIGVLLTYIINLLAPQFGWIDVPLDSVLLLGGLFTLISVAVFFRIVYRTTLSHLRRRGFDQRRILIIGALDPGQLVYRSISRDASLGYRVMGFASDAIPEGATVANSEVLCNFAGIGTTIRKHGIDLVIVALSGRASHELFDIIMSAEDEHVEVKLYPDAFTLITNNVISDNDVAGLPLLNVRNGALANPLNQFLKRLFDLAFAAAVLILLSPLMLLIALLIKLESKGPAFFIQPRVGIDGKPFPTIKFRTMRVDAPNLANWTTQDDPRKTKIGAFLRKTSLDELPNFINVIRGEMSVVGPRPEQEVWVERFSQQIPYYMRRHKQKAGVTGWAQANGLRGDTSIEDRTRYDLYYVENWSLLFDIKICIKTFVDIVTGRNKGY
jgi:exopolysaccharide biosynthesis polyprenyl glycosylphosphotransferase